MTSAPQPSRPSPKGGAKRPDASRACAAPAPVLACLSYAVCSTSLTLANKLVFSDDLNYPWTLLAVQSAVVTLLLTTFQLLRRHRPFSLTLLRQMFIPCILFTLYIFTNSRALRRVSLPILSVLKSLAPMGIALAERIIFADPITGGTAAAMALIVIGNGVTMFNDLEYSADGYGWAIANVVVNIAYVLSLRTCLSDSFTPIEKTIHSNLMAAVFMFPLAVGNREFEGFLRDFNATTQFFRNVYFVSCVLAAAIGASIFWVVQATSGSTLSFVGACNKFSVVILGGLLFHARISVVGWISVFFGVLAGVVFAVAKTTAKEKEKEDTSEQPGTIIDISSDDDDRERVGEALIR